MDRFSRGFVAGVLAAIPLNAWNLFSYYVLGLADLRLLDWAGVAVYGTIPQSSLQVASALAMQHIWSGFRGIMFSYLIPNIRSQGYIGKGVVFSLIISFFESGITVLYQVPHLALITTGTVLSAQIGSVLWGALLAYLILRLDGTTEKAG